MLSFFYHREGKSNYINECKLHWLILHSFQLIFFFLSTSKDLIIQVLSASKVNTYLFFHCCNPYMWSSRAWTLTNYSKIDPSSNNLISRKFFEQIDDRLQAIPTDFVIPWGRSESVQLKFSIDFWNCRIWCTFRF